MIHDEGSKQSGGSLEAKFVVFGGGRLLRDEVKSEFQGAVRRIHRGVAEDRAHL
jgi:hypothetical protein